MSAVGGGGRLRLAPARSGSAVPVDEAVKQAQAHWDAAREAYVDLLAVFGGHWLHALLRADEQVTFTRLRGTRDEAQRMAERALAVVAAVDACIDVCERSER